MSLRLRVARQTVRRVGGDSCPMPWNFVVRIGLLAVALSQTAVARTLYVATTGDDANDCLSLVSACRSVQHAVDVSAPTGDTIELQPGSFVENVVIDFKSLSIQGRSGYVARLDGAGVDTVVSVGSAADVMCDNLP